MQCFDAYHVGMNPTEAIKRAGSVSALARILDVPRQSIQQYRNRGSFPADRLAELRARRPEWFASKT